MAATTLFSDFLILLGVPHTAAYSDMRFKAYPSKHTFTALQDLLAEYAVLSTLTSVTDKDLSGLKCPFVARTSGGFMIVESVSPTTVTAMTKGSRRVVMPVADFKAAWTGDALTADPMKIASEPDYALHRRKCLANMLFRCALVAISLFLALYFFITNHIGSSWSATVALILLAGGIYVTHLLVLKESHVDSGAADALCGVIEKAGCSTVLASGGSAFLGVIPWAEVGLTYFSVSFLALLIFPWATLPYLAVIGACCLPYTIWSVLYQKFKAKAWCTMCLTVQTIFWLLFFTYLAGGDFHGLTPLRWNVIILMLASYGLFISAIHLLIPRIFHTDRAEAASTGGGTSSSSGT